MTTKICQGCNTDITGTHPNRKYCTKKCRDSNYYRIDPERWNAQTRAYYQENKDQLKPKAALRYQQKKTTQARADQVLRKKNQRPANKEVTVEPQVLWDPPNH